MNQPTSSILEYFPPDEVGECLNADENQILDTINQRVAAGENLPAIMDYVFDATRSLYPCDRIGIAFLEDNGQRVVAHWARALYEPLYLGNGYAEDLRGSSLEAVIETGRVRFIHDLETYLEYKPMSVSTELLIKEGVRSSMTCPLHVDNRRIGFMFRSSREPHCYTRRHAAFHLRIAERLSQAVEKAYRIEQLEEANRAYTEMLGFVSHELKSPVSSIVMDANVLLGEYLGPLADKQRAKLEKIVTKSQYLLGLVREYLDLARIEAGDLEPTKKEVDFVSDVFEPSLDIVQSQIDDNQATLETDFPTDGKAKAFCDPDLMRIVMVNLLSNAVKYGNKEGHIRVRLDPDGDVFVGSVWNEGPGFPDSERSRLFRRFSRLQTPELVKRKGTGVGLFTTWQIVQLHDGRIYADSEHGSWAEFTFELPHGQNTEKR